MTRQELLADSHHIRRQVPNDHDCANLSATVVRYEILPGCFVDHRDLRYVEYSVQEPYGLMDSTTSCQVSSPAMASYRLSLRS